MSVGVAEAAAELGVGMTRVRALIASGALEASRVAGVWLVDEEALEAVKRRSRPAHVRSFSPRIAWACAAVADGVVPRWLTGPELSRLIKRMDASSSTGSEVGAVEAGVWQARLRGLGAERRLLRAAPALLDRLLDDDRVARSGGSVCLGSDWADVELPTGGAQASLWVRTAADLAALAQEYGLLASSTGNVKVSVAGLAQLPSCGPGDGNAYRLAVAADLLGASDARSRRTGQQLLEIAVAERRWSRRRARHLT